MKQQFSGSHGHRPLPLTQRTPDVPSENERRESAGRWCGKCRNPRRSRYGGEGAWGSSGWVCWLLSVKEGGWRDVLEVVREDRYMLEGKTIVHIRTSTQGKETESEGSVSKGTSTDLPGSYTTTVLLCLGTTGLVALGMAHGDFLVGGGSAVLLCAIIYSVYSSL
ncbi:hypothetical protein E2C01_084375 [Portunus trituberculatus]|uniref:Uncharacterized protein n=1 Tax=Portunus trituberculatus TaxID=210409 RepID=A0A5B7J424_PORTR|nr:hypothetical protein [Portunus trituberculatus]